MTAATDQRLLTLSVQGLDAEMLLTHLEGEEAISTPFHFLLTVASSNTAFSPQDWLGKAVTIKITDGGENQTTYNGLVAQFQQGPLDYDGWRSYQIVLKPWLSFLTHHRDCRIFQQQTVPQIISQIFKNHHCADYDASQLQLDHQPRPYCVQYNETDFDFVNRLLEEAGIYYTFKQCDNKHTLVLADSGFAQQDYPQAVIASNDTHTGCSIHNWQENVNLQQTNVMRLDYQFQAQQPVVETAAQRPDEDIAASQHFQNYRYPTEVAHHSDEHLQQHANQKVQEGLVQDIHGQGNYVGFAPGLGFGVSSSGNANGRFMLTRVKFTAHDDSHRGHQTKSQGEIQHYHNEFCAIPSDQRFVPAQKTPKPKIHNIQTAVVVGPKGKPIYTDRYGRVKVQFHWDRYGKMDENSSCWLRTQQPWAGDNHGAVCIPRIGQEVLVDFEDANPDRPMIVGTVANSDHLPPFTPATTPSRSGFQTQTLGATSSDQGNTLYFDDDAKKPQVYFKAQKDYALASGGDSQHAVGGDYLEMLASGDYQHDCDGALSYRAAKEIRLTCGSSEILINQSGVSVQGDSVAINPNGGGVSIPTSTTDSSDLLHQVIGKLSPATSLKTQNTQKKDIIPLEELIYVTGTKTLYALTEDELTALTRAAIPLQKAITDVITANQVTGKNRNAQIKTAKAALNKTLKPLVHSPSSNDITEIVQFHAHKWTYVPQDKLQSLKGSWRKYDVDSEANAKSIMTNGKVDLQKLKSKLSNNAKVNFSHDVSGSIGDWARTINQKAHFSDVIFGTPNGPKLTATGAAQLMRYTAGLSGGGDFDLKDDRVSFSADGHAELAIAEAQVNTKCSIPSEKGWQLNFTCKGLNGKEQQCNFGAIRLDADLGLFGFAGASVLGSVDVACQVDQTSGKLELKGTNKEGKTETAAKDTQAKTSSEDQQGQNSADQEANQPDENITAAESSEEKTTSGEKSKEDESGNGATVGVNAFAGAKAGCQAGCGILWQNPEPPEGGDDSDASSGSGAENGLRWSELASLSAEGDAAAGIGGDAEFRVTYNPRREKFIVEAEAGIICGFGLSGNICTVVYAENILSFVQFIYHKIMSKNFAFIGFIEDEAFKQLGYLLIKCVFDVNSTIPQLLEKGFKKLDDWWNGLTGTFEYGDQQLIIVEKLTSGICKNPANLKFTPPEMKGCFLYMLTDPKLPDQIKAQSEIIARRNADLSDTPLVQSEMERAIQMAEYAQMHQIEKAILYILSYIQSHNDYINVMQHMTLNLTSKTNPTLSEHRLYNGLGVYGRSQVKALQKFREHLDDKDKSVIYPESIENKINRPIEQNQHILDIIMECFL